jgi:RNA polymerase sigma-70 factor (ECF subfamily)
MSFDDLYERHSREVWALAYARRMDADIALDVVQEAFFRFWRELNRGERIHNPRAWLLRVARNLAEDEAKSAFRRNGTHPPQFMASLHGREPQPLDRLIGNEQSAKLREMLRLASEADREVLTLRYALDYSTEQIAEALGVNVAAVHMRLTRARQRLAERLAEAGVGAREALGDESIRGAS